MRCRRSVRRAEATWRGPRSTVTRESRCWWRHGMCHSALSSRDRSSLPWMHGRSDCRGSATTTNGQPPEGRTGRPLSRRSHGEPGQHHLERGPRPILPTSPLCALHTHRRDGATGSTASSSGWGPTNIVRHRQRSCPGHAVIGEPVHRRRSPTGRGTVAPLRRQLRPFSDRWVVPWRWPASPAGPLESLWPTSPESACARAPQRLPGGHRRDRGRRHAHPRPVPLPPAPHGVGRPARASDGIGRPTRATIPTAHHWPGRGPRGDPEGTPTTFALPHFLLTGDADGTTVTGREPSRPHNG